MIPFKMFISSHHTNLSRKERGVIHFSHILIMALLIFTVYFNSINNGFVADDNAFVKDNISIRNLNNFALFFYETDTVATSKPEWGTLIYRPLRTLSFAFDYYLYGINATGYHLTNLILYIMVCISLYFLIFQLFDHPLTAFLGALLFGIHPLHVEAVSWIASRADIIGLLFLNLSLVTYVYYRKYSNLKKYFFLSLSFSFIAYLGKETMVCLPGIIILYDYATQNKKSLLSMVRSNFTPWVCFALVCAIYLVLRFSITGKMDTAQEWWGGSPWSNFLMMAKATAVYLRLLIFPFKLNIHYVIEPVSTIFNLKVLFSLSIIALSFALIIYSYRRNRIIFFSLVWFYLALIPISNIVPISFSMMAERYIFMPSVGPIIAMSYGLVFTFNKAKAGMGKSWERLIIATIVLICLAFSITVIFRNKVYKSQFTFFSSVVASSPNSAPSLAGLAGLHKMNNDYEKALEYYERALNINADYAEVIINTAEIYQMFNKNEPIVQMTEKAISLKPDDAYIRFNAGNIFRMMGELNRAKFQWEKAVEINPNYSEAFNSLGNYYLMNSDYNKAIDMFQKSLELSPLNAEAHYNIANTFEKLGDEKKSMYHYLRFTELAGNEYKDLSERIKKRFQ